MTTPELKLPTFSLESPTQELRTLSLCHSVVKIKVDFTGLSPHVIDLLTKAVIESFPHLDIVSVGREGWQFTATHGWNETIFTDLEIEEFIRKTEAVIREYKDFHDMPDLIDD